MNSFSGTDYRGSEVKGTVIYEDEAESFCLVDEDSFPSTRTLWLIDKLDDVGISLDAEQIRELVPHLQRWADPNSAEIPSKLACDPSMFCSKCGGTKPTCCSCPPEISSSQVVKALKEAVWDEAIRIVRAADFRTDNEMLLRVAIELKFEAARAAIALADEQEEG